MRRGRFTWHLASRWTLALTAVAALAAVAAGCGRSDSNSTPSSTPTASATASPATSATQAVDAVRQIDFTDPAVIGPLVDHFSGGEVDPARVLYVDMTGDSVDDAFVVVESGGTAGDLGAALLTVEDGAPAILGYVDAGGRVELRFPEAGGGVVVVQTGVYEPGDAECCPTNLRERTYRWDESGFELVTDQVVDNPDVD
jgi:hypothetical protein